MLLSELLSWNQEHNQEKLFVGNRKLTIFPGPSMTPGRFGRNEESCSLTFLLLNLL